MHSENLLGVIASEAKACEDVVRVINVPAVRGGDYLHVYMDSSSRKGLGFFGPRQDGDTSEEEQNSEKIPLLETERA